MFINTTYLNTFFAKSMVIVLSFILDVPYVNSLVKNTILAY
jgi:hypothetical protein